MLIDTHAHIHFDEYQNDLEDVFRNCQNTQVEKIITVGTDDIDSQRALEFVWDQNVLAMTDKIDLFATAGLHPHEANKGPNALLTIKELVEDGGYGKKLVAVGECGLDYYRNLSSKTEQQKALEFQIELAQMQGLPLIFHVRDAWDNFFAIIKNYKDVRGVIHSFTGGPNEVEKVSGYNLYFGLNGIITFTKNQKQLDAAKLIPEDKLLLETDCPFLAPEPVRSRRNEPANVKYIAEFLAKLRNQSFENIVQATTINTKTLFNL